MLVRRSRRRRKINANRRLVLDVEISRKCRNKCNVEIFREIRDVARNCCRRKKVYFDCLSSSASVVASAAVALHVVRE